ncbi:hypothetical protein JFU37_26730 [Pseudomonas sp. TH41]|uniref:NACHT domain-containing protein n=1 Tax=Pseudomonas sp. TH41 TaxID=2796405 RepID=UPI0019139868|nr:hypothetical protein [Pseudomonas sp. TH41]MBK5356072.1 hypothetical protein [Pseudomonas sp. TH41]
MTGHLDAFIPLERTFSKIILDPDAGDDSDLSAAPARSGVLQWSDLLSHHRVIVLSEAGSGKTAEIRNVARQLRAEGKSAFFLRIEYVRELLEGAFEEGTFEEFQSWCASGTEGWLLMDSVDEARLRDPRDFEMAIRKIGLLIKGMGARAHILITGRSTAWRARTDLLLCQQAFPYELGTRQVVDTQGAQGARTEEKLDELFLLVTLDDIHGEQIDRFLSAAGVQDMKAFRIAVDRKEAWSLTTRPQDFLELVDFWDKHHRIGTRFELMKSSIERRLEERDQNRSELRPISAEKLREGVRLIAAATTLGQTSAIRVPDGEDNKKGIPIRAVLKHWNDAECAALLSRPVFDEGIYGTVRFHHRSVREYLTAEWLYRLILDEASRVKIENLFFRTQYGLEVIDPTMRPILPWVALLDVRVCARVARVAPEVFFEGGDPGQLPLSTRRSVLRKACEQLAQPAHSWGLTDYSAVQRFANIDLTQDIRELLDHYRTNDDIVWFLLRMIWQGEVVGALHEAKQFALNAQNKYTRSAAIRAVIDLGSPQDIADVRDALLAGTRRVNRDWLAELLDDIPLDERWLPWLMKAIRRSEKQERFSGSDTLAARLSAMASECPLASLPALISGLSALLDKPPVVERGFCTVSKRYGWLLEIAGIAVFRLLEARDTFALDQPALSILCKLPQAQMFNELDARELCDSIRKFVPSWPQLDYQLFWHDVALARKGRVHREEPVVSVWQLIGFRPFWSFNKTNFELACDDIVNRPVVDDRLMALSMAFQIYAENDKPTAWESRLRKATEPENTLYEKFESLLNPPVREVQEWELNQAQWKEESAQRQALEEEHRRSWREGLAADVARLNGSEPGVMTRSQAYLMDRMGEGSSTSNTWRSGDWKSLSEEFGLPVAQAFREGAIRFWRSYCPTLPSEGAAVNTTPYQVIFGLIGVGIEAREEPSRFSQMSVENAEYAARYGLLELNGFPDWLPKLFGLFPDSVLQIVLREIEYELNAEYTESFSYYVLQKTRWGGGWMYESLAAPLLALLESPMRSLEALQLALSIVQDSPIGDEVLAKLASKRAIEETNPELAPTWYAVWIGTEPDVAIPALASRIDTLHSDEDKANFAMRCLTVIVGNRIASRCRQNYKTVGHAKSLYLLIHTHVRIAEDIDRSGGGVYSPGLRDDAQGARDALLAFIRETPGKEAFLALGEIAREHPAEHLRPWSAFYAEQKATADARTPPWEPEKVVEFHEALESTPSNHRDLWNLAIDRLSDLKHDLENGDSSIAEILIPFSQETSIRKFIGNWCRDRAAGRYIIPQEEQLADDKRPDFRVQSSLFDGPVPVELKLADKWTGSQLFERLENQLCGDYLRDIRSSCGIFLLVCHGDKNTWSPPGKKRLAFDDLVTALQQHGEILAARYPNVEDIKVIGIDLTKRGGRAAIKPAKADREGTLRKK